MNNLNLSQSFFLQEKHLQSIRQLGALIQPHLASIIDEFYAWLRAQQQFSLFFHSEAHVAMVKKQQMFHWQMFWAAEIDQKYVDSRKRIGETHARIGLPLDLYYKSVLALNDFFEKAIDRLGVSDPLAIWSFNKLANFDVSIVVDSYNSVISETIQAQNAALSQMSTPVAQLWDGILLLPLVGIIDSKRAQDVMIAVLNKIADTQSKVFILDISGIAVLDTAVANHLIKITKAAKLMGCICTISGISPSVAQTIVELGIDTNEVNTHGSMKDALQEAFKQANCKIVSVTQAG